MLRRSAQLLLRLNSRATSNTCWNPRLLEDGVVHSSETALDAVTLTCKRWKSSFKMKKGAPIPGLIYWKPRTPSLRHKISYDYEGLGVYTGKPHPLLSMGVKNTAGRCNTGRVVSRGRGGGRKKVLRWVDFKRDLEDVPGVIQRIEFDPGRSGWLALVKYEREGEKPVLKYHLAPKDAKVGDKLLAGDNVPLENGNTLQLRFIPLGIPIHNIELTPGKGGQLCRAAMTSAVILSKQEEYAVVRLPSGEQRLVNLLCRATIGLVSNHLNTLEIIGKAGENRLRGRRPIVRGVAKGVGGHPHAGSTQGRPSTTPYGVYCKGAKTRRPANPTNKFIVMSRHKANRSKQ